jgi:septal ring factor EnvC (AmiA/AmiB activator)
MKINKTTLNNISRLLLRSVPMIPAPELYDIIKGLNESKKNINEKIDKAYQSLKDTSDLVEDLQKELKDRTERVKSLKEEYERYSELAEIEESKAKALLTEINRTVNKGKNQERLIGFFLNIMGGVIIFILGIWLGPKITNLILNKNNAQMEQTVK